MSNTKILFPYPHLYPFIIEDIKTLEARYEVEKYHFKPSKSLFGMIWEFSKSWMHTWRHLPTSDIVYSFFPGYHSLIPILLSKYLRKKSIIILGGYESVHIPSIPYGAIAKKNLYGRIIRWQLRNVDYLLAVDDSLISGTNIYADPKGIGYEIGVKNFIDNLKAICKTIPTGYDPDKWKPSLEVKRQKSIVSVGNAQDAITYKRKGFDFLLEIAKEMPETNFTFIGLSGSMLEEAKKTATSNCIFPGFIENHLLPSELSKYKVVAQLSMSEGLPNSLCEAMLCECIPVGSNVNGIPKAIGNSGYIVMKKNKEEAITAFSKALDAPMEKSKEARDRIRRYFHTEKRQQELYSIIEKCIN
jgi:glycosyltransferase involved in cell wall biosynthesis